MKEFLVNRPWAVFCSKDCRMRWNRAVPYTCFFCGVHGPHKVGVSGPEWEAIRGVRFFSDSPSVVACDDCGRRTQTMTISTMAERFDFLIDALTREHRLFRGVVEWDPDEIEELGPTLRRNIEHSLAVRRAAEDRVCYLRTIRRELDRLNEPLDRDDTSDDAPKIIAPIRAEGADRWD